MSIHPFVVGAGHHREFDYGVIVAPRPVLEVETAGARSAAAALRRILHSSPDEIEQGAAYAAPWIAPDGTAYSVVWRPTVSASAYWLGATKIPMRDFLGRMIRIDEGFFCPVGYLPAESDFEIVHAACQPHFARFWRASPPWVPPAAGPLTREANDRDGLINVRLIDVAAAGVMAAQRITGRRRQWHPSSAVSLPSALRGCARLAFVPRSNAVVIAGSDRIAVSYPTRRGSMRLRELPVSAHSALVTHPESPDVAFLSDRSLNLLSARDEPVVRSHAAPSIGPDAFLVMSRTWEAITVSRIGVTIWRCFPLLGWHGIHRSAQFGPITALEVPQYGWCEPVGGCVRLLTGDREGRIRVYGALDTNGPCEHVADLGRPIDAVALSRDQRHILSVVGTLFTLHVFGHEAITLLDTETALVASGFVMDDDGMNERAWSLTASGIIAEWTLAKGERLAQWELDCGRLVAAARSAPGGRLATLSAAGELQIWESGGEQADAIPLPLPVDRRSWRCLPDGPCRR